MLEDSDFTAKCDKVLLLAKAPVGSKVELKHSDGGAIPFWQASILELGEHAKGSGTTPMLALRALEDRLLGKKPTSVS
jgi:hypothetical protein